MAVKAVANLSLSLCIEESLAVDNLSQHSGIGFLAVKEGAVCARCLRRSEL